MMTSESSQGAKYQLSAKGMIAYVSLWATIFAVVRVLADHSSIGAKGSYPYTAGLVTDFLLPVAIGLVFVAVGVAVAYSLGAVTHYRAVVVWCFLIGCFFLPFVWFVVVLLAWLGFLSLD